MQELRTQENDKFLRFVELVRSFAAKQGCVFFVDCGEGRDFETETMEGEDLSGWLIPQNKVTEDFHKAFAEAKVPEEWDDFLRIAVWNNVNGKINITFEAF